MKRPFHNRDALHADTPVAVTAENFQLGPDIVVVLPDPEPGMEGKALKLERLTAKQMEILKTCLAAGFAKAREQEMLPHQITLEIYQRTPRDPPDIGIGIMSGGRTIQLAVNPAKIATLKFQETLKRLIPHEDNHVLRDGYLKISVNTIGDAIISEGFGLKAEILAGFPPADYNRPQNAAALAAYIEKVLPALNMPTNEPGNGYDYWMFGVRAEGEKKNEAFGGYPLGHAIVARYMECGHSMSEAMRTPNDEIMGHWKSELAQDGAITSQSIHAWAEKNFHWVDPSVVAASAAPKRSIRHPATSKVSQANKARR